jgi:hypothetical protein
MVKFHVWLPDTQNIGHTALTIGTVTHWESGRRTRYLKFARELKTHEDSV